MKRLAAALVFVACSPPIVDPPPPGTSIELALLDTTPTVVRGSSTRVRVTIGTVVNPTTTVHLAIASLPEGVTAPAIDWKPTDPQPSLTITASTDAPETESPFTVNATSDGTLLGSVDGELAVSELTGSLDPSFGQGGVVTPNVGLSLRVFGMRQQSDGKWILVGDDANAGLQIVAFLERLTPNGALDVTFGQDGLLEVLPNDHQTATSFQSVAFAPDDRIAIGLERTSDNVIIELDKDGNILSNVTTTHLRAALAWDGDGIVVGSLQTLQRLDTQTTTGTTDFQVAALATSAAGGVWAYGDSPLTLARYGTPALGETWSLALPGAKGSGLGASELDVDANGRALVALVDPALARVLPDGTFDPSWGSAGVAPLLGGTASATWVHQLSSGAAVAVGALTNAGPVVTETSPAGAAIPFGTYGRARLCPMCVVDTAAVDLAEKRVCVAQESPQTNPFVACYLLAP